MNRYTRLLAFVTFIFLSSSAFSQDLNSADNFEIRMVAGGLADPWEVTCGPDDHLWVTESKGYRVVRIHPETGDKQVLLDLNPLREFPRYDKIDDKEDGGKPWPQGGLMGMALHPMLLEGKPYVYLAYVYRYKGADADGDGKLGAEGYQFLARIVRYHYDATKGILTQPETLSDAIPASNDHNGGRLLVAPQNGAFFLFYSTGDMGAGQFSNGGRTNHAQNPDSYEGKVLRFNTEPDGSRSPWIPDDNPFNSKGETAVWSVGHRNPQGLAYARIGGRDLLFSTEHGPYSDDEVNRIERGGNYGHPLVIGYADGNYDGLAASVSDREELPGQWNTSYPHIKSEKENARSLHSYRDPIFSFYPTSGKDLQALFDKAKSGRDADWKAYAPSSIAVYQSDAIPGWKNSLLIPTLKGARLLRLKLDKQGDIADSAIHAYAKGEVRYRDVAISRDGMKIYLAVDSSSVTSGPSEENPEKISYRGSIIELRYTPKVQQDAGGVLARLPRRE